MKECKFAYMPQGVGQLDGGQATVVKGKITEERQRVGKTYIREIACGSECVLFYVSNRIGQGKRLQLFKAGKGMFSDGGRGVWDYGFATASQQSVSASLNQGVATIARIVFGVLGSYLYGR